VVGLRSPARRSPLRSRHGRRVRRQEFRPAVLIGAACLDGRRFPSRAGDSCGLPSPRSPSPDLADRIVNRLAGFSLKIGKTASRLADGSAPSSRSVRPLYLVENVTVPFTVVHTASDAASVTRCSSACAGTALPPSLRVDELRDPLAKRCKFRQTPSVRRGAANMATTPTTTFLATADTGEGHMPPVPPSPGRSRSSSGRRS